MKYSLVFENDRIKDYKSEKLIEIPSSLDSEKSLIDFYRKKLNFPYYFGNNWDAFYDILSDLYWTNQGQIIVYHDSLPKLAQVDLITYLKIIKDLIKFSVENDKSLKFVFHPKDKEKIQSLINMHL